MFRKKTSTQRSMLGIEITPARIKIVELSNRNASYHLENYAFCSLPEGVIQQDKIENLKGTIHCLKALLAKTHFSTKSAVLALPDSAVTTIVLQCSSALTKLEMEEAVINETLLRHPALPNEISVDFTILDSSPNQEMMANVLVIATRAANVRARINLCRGVGLSAKIVDVEAHAVHRLVKLSANYFDKESTIVAVTDVGQAEIRLFVLEAHRPLVTLRRESLGHSPEDKANGIKEMLSSYTKNYTKYPNNHFILTRDYNKRASLIFLLEQLVKFQIQAINPFTQLITPSPSSYPTNELEFGANYLIACGLALRLAK